MQEIIRHFEWVEYHLAWIHFRLERTPNISDTILPSQLLAQTSQKLKCIQELLQQTSEENEEHDP